MYGDSVFVNGAAVSKRDLPFSHGIIQVVESVLEVPVGDLQAVVVSSGHSYSRVNTLLTVTQLVDAGTYTLLAPPDSAITSKGYSWPRLLMTRALGRDLLARHTLRGAWYTEGLLLRRTISTLAGTSVTFRKDLDGTISANGVPLRSYNLTAVNGVLHLTADVIPEYDLGTDPTTIPNPLLGQTEVPPLASFTFPGDKVPDVSAISGLYDTPDRDPYQDFIPSSATSLVKQPGVGVSERAPGVPESQLPPVPSFHEYIESFRFSSVPPTENNIHTVHSEDDHTTQGGEPSLDPKHDSLQGSETTELHRPGSVSPYEDTGSQIVQPPGQSLLDTSRASEGEQEDETTASGGDASSQTGGDEAITTTRDSTSIANTLHTENTFHDVNEEGNTVVPVTAVSENTHSHLPAGEGSPPQLSQGKRRNCSTIVRFGVTYTAIGDDGRVNTQDHTSSTAQRPAALPPGGGTPGSFGGPTIYPGEGRVNPGVPQHLIPPVPLVPEGAVLWSPAGLVTEEERARLDVLDLLQRLNLTKFAELIDLAGLTYTLSLKGPWTVFAPTNDAITALPEDALQQIVSHRRFLRRLVSYHLAPGRFTSSSYFTPGTKLPTLHAGHILVLNYYTDGPAAWGNLGCELQRWVAGGSIITDLDEGATNGVVHVVDRFLYAPYGDLAATLALSPILTTFRQLLTADIILLNYLSGPGPFTVFVPSDDALQNVTFPQDLLVRRGWMLSHVVLGTWYTAGFSNIWPLVSNSNDTITTFITPDQDQVTANGAEIIYADITISDGVIHVLKSPLFTPT
ncbi:uncharacterized protein [Panulirus ornatus]|uniref:uncharacterized protein isoform X2 n=1 Tax=Panulirus ornatus TaxID=150431 RepID=UPI003A891254